MTSRIDLLIVGTGSLAETTLRALVVTAGRKLTIALVGRNRARISWLRNLFKVWTKIAAVEHTCVFHWSDIENSATFEGLLSSLQPRVIFVAASLQSAWELDTPSRWSGLVRKTGYAATLPLQAILLAQVIRAATEKSPRSKIVNGCYPDILNSLLVKIGLPVLCGVGNIAIIAELLTARDSLVPRSLHMYAGHCHISQLINKETLNPTILGIYNGKQLSCLDFNDLELPANASINEFTGVTAAQLLAALVDPAREYVGHAPGPLGMAGGFPIQVITGRISLRNLDCLPLQAAISINEAFSAQDGILLKKDIVIFSEKITTVFKEERVGIPSSFPVQSLLEIGEELRRIKSSMLPKHGCLSLS